MTDSIQQQLLRVRSPVVHITYDVETGGATEKRELPFVIGILADLSGDRVPSESLPPLLERHMLAIDRNNFNDSMQAIAPRVDLALVLQDLPELRDSKDAADKAIVLHAMDDFEPLSLVLAVPALRAKYEARRTLRKTQARQEAAGADVSAIDAQVADIDRELSKALSTIMHAPSFRAVEATWRSLFYFVSRTDTGDMLKLQVVNATKAELLADFQHAIDVDQGTLFKQLYEAAYGKLGGEPFSVLVAGYEFGAGNDDIELLKQLATVGAAMHAPVIAAASCDMFSLPGFDKLGKPRVLAKAFEGMDLQAWRDLRDMEDARYLALVLPRVLLRLPYGAPPLGMATEGFNFEEFSEGQDNALLAWGNAAYFLAERIANALSLYRWPAAFDGAEGGGLVESLPIQVVPSNDAGGDATLTCPVEVSITPQRQQELSELGFIPLCHAWGTGKAVFHSRSTVLRPKRYFDTDANANAQLSAVLPYVLAASRFAHYIKVIMREKIGSFLTRANVEAFLNTWISNYVLLDDNAPPEAKAAYPLRAASIVVTDVPGTPGAYTATLFIRPHFQLEELTTSIRLQIELPA